MKGTLHPDGLHYLLRRVAQAAGSSSEPNLRLLGLGFAALLVAGAFQTAPASAVVYVVPTDESLVDRSPVIVFGEILSAGPGPVGSGPTTDYLFAIEEVLKGFVAGSAIMVRQPGGVGVDGTAMKVMGLPMLAEGDRVLLFLRPEESGAHPIVEYALGMFWEVDMGGRPMLLREPSLQAWAPMPGGDSRVAEPARRDRLRDGARFRHWIADRAAGVERSADYFEKEPPEGPVAVQSPYRLWRTQADCLHDLMPIRWQDFDLGKSLRMTVHSGGQVGVPGGGTAGIRTAMRAWNNDLESHVRLATAGTATPTEENTQPDSDRYWIPFEDPFDQIDGSFDEETGGTLAVTINYWFCGGQVPVHSTLGDPPVQALQIGYTQLITQDGYGEQWVALNENPQEAHEEIMAHELGHVLGIGHSCGFGVYPCPDDGAIAEAIMRAYPHADGRGARLSSDDLAALRYLYPMSSGTGGEPDALVCSGVTCLLQGERFRVKAWYSSDGGPNQGAGAIAAAIGGSAGLFTSNSDSAELLVRIADQCSASGYRAVYTGAASDADFRVAVRDTDTNELKWFRSRDGQAVADAEAFLCGVGETSEPDLVVSSASVSDSSLDAGATFTLSATVRNQGDGRSSSTTLRYYRSSNSTITASDTEVGTDAVRALSASGTSGESIVLTAPSTPGTYYYGACVESVSGESNTGNNCSSGVRVTVSSAGSVTEYRYDDGTPIGFVPADDGFHLIEYAQRFRLPRSGTVEYAVVCVGRRTTGGSNDQPLELNFYTDSGSRPSRELASYQATPRLARGTSACRRLALPGSGLRLGSGNTWVGLSWRLSTGMVIAADTRATGSTSLSARVQVTPISSLSPWLALNDLEVVFIRLGVNHGGSTATTAPTSAHASGLSESALRQRF